MKTAGEIIFDLVREFEASERKALSRDPEATKECAANTEPIDDGEDTRKLVLSETPLTQVLRELHKWGLGEDWD